MIERGRAVRERREALGVSREDASAETRIPVAHLAALEEGRLQALPAGPYAEAWMRTLEAHFGLPVGPGGTSVATPPASGAPLWVVRVVAGVAVGGLLAALVWRYGGDAARIATTPQPAADGVDQEVIVRALRNTSVTVIADGVVVREGELPGGEEIEVRAADRIELQVAATGALRLDYNGERIVPLGRQDEPRRLVFVDDGGGGP